MTLFADDNKKYLSTSFSDNSLKSKFVDDIELLDFTVERFTD